MVATGPREKPARGRIRDTLFVNLALNGEEASTAALYRGVTDALVDAYYLSGGSVTAALRQAIQAASEHLVRHNARAEGVEKQQAGVTCAVLRDEEVFVAQAGQTLAFVGHQGRLERLPPRPSGYVTPLGAGNGLDTRFYHSWVHPGDVLLLAEPALEEQSDETIGGAIIYEGVASGINKLSKLLNGDGNTRLMLVEFAAATVPAPGNEPGSVGTQEPEPATETSRYSAPAAPASAAGTRKLRNVSVDVRDGVRRVAAGAASGLARLTRGLGEMIERLFGGRVTEEQAVKNDQGLSPAVMAVTAVVIPVLVALVAVGVYLQRGQVAHFNDLLLQLERESRLAQAAGADAAAERAHWEQTLLLSDAALHLRPSHETVQQFREQSGDALDVLDEVTRLTVRPLLDYPQGGAAALTVQSLAVYALDTDYGRVHKRLLESELKPAGDAEPETVLFVSQAVGAEVVGRLVDLTWFPRSGDIREDTVAVLDSTGLLVRYRPAWGDVIASRLATPPEWNVPRAIAVYGDGLYVLDTGAGQVWRFDARDGGFSEPGEAYSIESNEDGDPSNDVDLRQMIDMAIDRDGHLFLLGSDGVVYKFFGGKRKPFSFSELEEPLVAPTAIFCSLTGLNPLFYVADPGSGRIVQTTQQGLFLAQYRPRPGDLADLFSQTEDLYVQETPLLRIYFVGGGKVAVASLD